jgi:hypothetical protein
MKIDPHSAERPWTPKEDDELQNLLAARHERNLIARKLNRTISSVQRRVRFLNEQSGRDERKAVRK